MEIQKPNDFKVMFDPFDKTDWDAYFSMSERAPKIYESAKLMFKPLSLQIDEYVSSIKKPDNQYINFLDWVKTNYSDEGYAHIQCMFLCEDAINHLFDERKNNSLAPEYFSPFQKYLAFPFWAHSKFRIARKLVARSSKELDVLDLGSGPGHFGLICRFLGHNFQGIDVISPPAWPGVESSIFDSLCEYFEVPVIHKRILPGVQLDLVDRYDLLTIQMGNFSKITYETVDKTGIQKTTTRLWTKDEWLFFIKDLVENVMKEKFVIHIHMGPNMVQEAVRAVSAISAESISERRTFKINESVDFSNWPD